jgi:hypothetical protein
MRFLAVLALIAGCKGDPKPTTPTGDPKPAADDPSCPLVVDGTSISAEDAEGGAAFVFVTTGDAAAVKARVAKLVELHNTRMPDAKGELGAVCNGCMADSIATPSKASVVDLPNGAKALFVAAKPEAAGELAAEVRMHGGHLSHGGATCAMSM